MKLLACQPAHIILYAGSFVRQKRRERISAALIGLEEALGVLVMQILPGCAVKKRAGLRPAISRGKCSIPHVVGFKGALPLCVERQGVDEIHDRVRRNPVNDFRDHAVCVFLYPVVDGLFGRVVKGRAVNSRVKDVGILL